MIAGVEPDPGHGGTDLPYIAPGFVDVHVHGWGGHDAMGDAAALDGMAQALLRARRHLLPADRRDRPAAGARRVRRARPGLATVGRRPTAPSRSASTWRGRSWPRRGEAPTIRRPCASRPTSDAADLEPLLDGLRLVTIAPELPGALELIGWLRARGVATSMGHSAATVVEARAGYAAGGTSTTHLFNAMTGRRAPRPRPRRRGARRRRRLRRAHRRRRPRRSRPVADRHDGSSRSIGSSSSATPSPWPGWVTAGRRIGGLEVEVIGDRVTLIGTTTLAGSVIALDTAVRNLVASGVSLPAAVAAASRNPLALLGVVGPRSPRGRTASRPGRAG